MKITRIISKLLTFFIIGVVCYFLFNAVLIFQYSSHYSETKSDVAIVLGAATYHGELSPVFRERLNHGIYLYQEGIVDYILLTGGVGEGETLADSEVAKSYVMSQDLPEDAILIETSSNYTIENLQEAKHIMDSLSLHSALIVSDPLHMKRSVALAEKLDMHCEPSPTKTSMYKSFFPKLKSLLYETFFYSLGQVAGKN